MTTLNPNNLSDFKGTDRLDLSNRAFPINGGSRDIGFGHAKAIAQLAGSVAVIDAAPEPVEDFMTLSERYGVKTPERGDARNQESLQTTFALSVHAMVGQFYEGLTATGILREDHRLRPI